METNKKRCCCRRKAAQTSSTEVASKDYPGVAINQADGEKTDADLVKERTATLNNNPRSDI